MMLKKEKECKEREKETNAQRELDEEKMKWCEKVDEKYVATDCSNYAWLFLKSISTNKQAMAFIYNGNLEAFIES
jgi:hypothetical protein